MTVRSWCWVLEAKWSRSPPRLTMQPCSIVLLLSDMIGAWRYEGVAMALRRWGFSVNFSEAHGK